MTRILLALVFSCLALEARGQAVQLNCTYTPNQTVNGPSTAVLSCPNSTVTLPALPPVVPPVIPPVIPPTGTCPMGSTYPDGCATAPLNTATPRHAGILASYGTKRPPWNVPGADYEVGLDPTLTLTDWHTLPTAVVGTGGTHYVRCTSGAMVLDKVDFTKGAGAFVYIGAGDSCTSLTITRSKLGCDSINTNGPGNVALAQVQKVITVTISDSDIDLGRCAGIGGGQVANSFGGVVFLRVHFENTGTPSQVGGGQFAYGGTQGATSISVSVTNSWLGNMNNVFPNASCTGPDPSAAHNNMVQWNKINSGLSLTFKFNTYYQSVNDSCIDQGGEMVQTYPNDGSQTPGKLATGEIAFNTIIAKRGSTGHTTASNAFNGGGRGCTGTCNFDTNWIDSSGMFSVSYGNGASAGWTQRSGGLFSGSPFTVLGTGAAQAFSP